MGLLRPFLSGDTTMIYHDLGAHLISMCGKYGCISQYYDSICKNRRV
jgi:hypothetical protein